MKNLVIGITGGIGAGKSSFSAILKENNQIVLNADDIAKNLMKTDESVKQQIINEFGNDCYIEGQLQTKVLATKAFNHPEKLKKLNKIVHPPTINFINTKIENLKNKHSLIFVEAALIFEAKMESLFDLILLVTAEENLRIERVVIRNNENASEVKSRILNQIPDEVKRGRADFVLENNGSIEELKEKTIFFLNLFKTMLK